MTGRETDERDGTHLATALIVPPGGFMSRPGPTEEGGVGVAQQSRFWGYGYQIEEGMGL